MEHTKDADQFAKAMFSHATNPRMRNKRGYIIEVKGKVEDIKSGPFANHYTFTATISSGTKYKETKNIKPSCIFSQIYAHYHNEQEHNEKKEIANLLTYLENKARRLPEKPGYFVPNSVASQSLETTLDEENGILTIHPFQ